MGQCANTDRAPGRPLVGALLVFSAHWAPADPVSQARLIRADRVSSVRYIPCCVAAASPSCCAGLAALDSPARHVSGTWPAPRLALFGACGPVHRPANSKQGRSMGAGGKAVEPAGPLRAGHRSRVSHGAASSLSLLPRTMHGNTDVVSHRQTRVSHFVKRRHVSLSGPVTAHPRSMTSFFAACCVLVAVSAAPLASFPCPRGRPRADPAGWLRPPTRTAAKAARRRSPGPSSPCRSFGCRTWRR
jgi:hypothetical protein